MLISAPLLIVAAWGLFNRKPWAHTLAVVAGTVEVVRELLGLFGGGGILSLVFPGVRRISSMSFTLTGHPR
ncbi:MAG: hypothetical protein U0528_13340 [Anaerolineae bacterium]